MERLPLWQIALRRIDMPVQKYIAIFIGGSFLLGLIVASILISLTGGFAEGALFAGFAGVLMLIFPTYIDRICSGCIPNIGSTTLGHIN